jgi:hypothetical protein
MIAVGPVARATVAVTAVLGFIALGVLAALSAAAPAGIAFEEVVIATTVTCIAVAELRPALAQRRAARACARLAISDPAPCPGRAARDRASARALTLSAGYSEPATAGASCCSRSAPASWVRDVTSSLVNTLRRW